MWANKPRYLHQHVADPGPSEVLEMPCDGHPGGTLGPQVIAAQKVQFWAQIWADANAALHQQAKQQALDPPQWRSWSTR
eukprot:1059157-Pyramimonas_sp.AAC.1